MSGPRQLMGRRVYGLVGAGVVALVMCLEAPQDTRLASAACPTGSSQDSISIYPPQQFMHFGSSTLWNYYDDIFTADTVAGWRYVVQIGNGNPTVSQRTISVNGQQYVGVNDLVSLRTIDVVQGDNTLDVGVKGLNESWIDVRIVRVKDPTFIVCPDTLLARAGTQTVHAFNVVVPTIADTATCTMRLINGLPNGAKRVTSGKLFVNGVQVLSASDFGTGKAVITRQMLMYPTDSIRFMNQNSGTTDTSQVTIQVRQPDLTPAVVTLTSPAVDTFLTTDSFVRATGSVADETPGWFRVNSRPPYATPAAFTDSIPLLADGRYPLSIQVINSACLATTLQRMAIRDRLPPALSVSWPTGPSVSVDSAEVTVQGSWADTILTAVTVNGDTVAVGNSGVFSRSYPLDLGPNDISIRGVDLLGHKTEFKRYVFRQTPNEPTARDTTNQGIGVDNLSETTGTTFLESVRFLYAGGTPVQTGVDTSQLDPLRASVLRGQVTSRDFGGLANDTVRVLDHLEYGLTVTRADGRFDMVVNGGGQLTLRFNKGGYLEAHRTVTPGWNEYVIVDSVAMIGKTALSTVVDLDNPIMFRSRFRTDTNGDRDIRLLFTAGTRANVVRAPGNVVSLANTRWVRVRASEYTVGTNGASSMPAALPPGSAYTYCVDLSLDEADSLRIPNQPEPQVTFTDLVRCYVRNFLGFPVGTAVPSGYYDRHTRRWIATADGVVIKILNTAGNLATVDSDGDGQTDSQARLDALAITAPELTALAQEYRAGDELWRSLTDHFSPKDDNVNLAQAAVQQSATAGKAGQSEGIMPDPTQCPACIVEAENRVLGERIPIVGTPYSLNYRSYRAPGDKAIRTLRMPVSGDTVPAGVQRIVVHLDVSGQRLTQEFSGSLTNRVAVIPWDGKDAFGRMIQGSVEATVSIGYQYALQYVSGSGGRSLGDQASSGANLGAASGDRSVGNIAWTRRKVSLGAPSAASAGLGGWTISPHHFYDINGRGALYFGDGRVAPNQRNYPVINTVASLPGFPENESANDVAYAPDGSLYIAGGWSIHRFKNGQLTRVAGKTFAGSYTDNVLGTNTSLRNPRQLTVAPDGSVYFIMSYSGSCNCQRVVQLGTDGYVRSIAGNGQSNGSEFGDGGLAVNAGFIVPQAVAVGPDGSVFVSDRDAHTIRRIAPNGYINRYAGNGIGASGGATGDSSGKATRHRIGTVDALSIDAQGNLYAGEFSGKRIRKITPDGMMTTIRRFDYIYAFVNDMTIGPDGALYVVTGSGADSNVGRVWRLDPETGWSESVVAGGTNTTSGSQYSLDGIPSLGCNLGWREGMDIAPNGDIYLAGGNVRKISPPIMASSAGEYSVPSTDATEIYVFDLRGRHLRTRDAITGVDLFRFAYDGNGQLAKIYDLVGDSTVITRSGNAVTIAARFERQTNLTLANGFLASVQNPANETIALDAGSDGLLRHYTDANNHTHDYTYGSDGRLERVDDDAGGQQTFQVSYSGLKRTVQRQTREGRMSYFAVTDLYDGTRQRRISDAVGLLTYTTDSADAKVRSWNDLGRMARTDSLAREPRFGFLAPMAARSTEWLPSGKARVVEETRAYSAGFSPPTTGGTFTSSVATNSRPPAIAAYNTATRALVTTSPAGRTTRLMLDALGRPVSYVVPGLDSVVVGYDSQHGRINLIQQGGRGVRYGFDGLGRLATIRDTSQLMTTLTYDDADRVTSVVRPGNLSTGYGYDDNGNLTSLTPPGRPAHGFGYTEVDLASQYVPPSAGLSNYLTRYRYNRDRQLYRIERPDSTNIRLDYHAAQGRLAEIATPRGSYRYYYGTSGLVDSISSPDTVTVVRRYDGGVLTMESWQGKLSGSVSLTVDRNFRPVSQQVSSSNADFVYDDDGLLTQAGDLAITRRSDNGLIKETTLGSVTTTESQSSVGELWELHAKYGGMTLFKSVYDRDSLGRITQIAETDSAGTRVIQYAYDADAAVPDSGFLTTVTVDGVVRERYAYDGNGNRMYFEGLNGDTSTAMYDEQDRLVRYKNTRFSYSASGELAKAKAGNDSTLYTYDPLDNLVQVTLANGDIINYLVDGRNRRVARKLNGVFTHRWLYQDQLEPVAEVDGAGAVLAFYVYGSRSHVPDYMVKGGVKYRIVADHLGSVRLVVNESGTIVQRMRYDAWGRVTEDTNPEFQCFGYAGGLWDGSSGLVRFGGRDYDPSVGRWTNKDQNRFVDEPPNLYAYCGSEPINWVDPDGTSKFPAGPEGLPPSWQPDPSNPSWRNPQFRDPSRPGEWIRFDKPQPGAPGWKGKPHWHHSGDPEYHFSPGDEIPGLPDCPKPFLWWRWVPWEIPAPIIILPPWPPEIQDQTPLGHRFPKRKA